MTTLTNRLQLRPFEKTRIYRIQETLIRRLLNKADEPRDLPLFLKQMLFSSPVMGLTRLADEFVQRITPYAPGPLATPVNALSSFVSTWATHWFTWYLLSVMLTMGEELLMGDKHKSSLDALVATIITLELVIWVAFKSGVAGAVGPGSTADRLIIGGLWCLSSLWPLTSRWMNLPANNVTKTR